MATYTIESGAGFEKDPADEDWQRCLNENSFERKLDRFRETIRIRGEEIDWLSFPLSAEERDAACLETGIQRSLVTYWFKDLEYTNSDRVPEELFAADRREISPTIYRVAERRAEGSIICGLKTRGRTRPPTTSDCHVLTRVLLNLRTAIKRRVLLFFLSLPNLFDAVDKVDAERDLHVFMVDESIRITSATSGSLWLLSPDPNKLQLEYRRNADNSISILEDPRRTIDVTTTSELLTYPGKNLSAFLIKSLARPRQSGAGAWCLVTV